MYSKCSLSIIGIKEFHFCYVHFCWWKKSCPHLRCPIRTSYCSSWCFSHQLWVLFVSQNRNLSFEGNTLVESILYFKMFDFDPSSKPRIYPARFAKSVIRLIPHSRKEQVPFNLEASSRKRNGIFVPVCFPPRAKLPFAKINHQNLRYQPHSLCKRPWLLQGGHLGVKRHWVLPYAICGDLHSSLSRTSGGHTMRMQRHTFL